MTFWSTQNQGNQNQGTMNFIFGFYLSIFEFLRISTQIPPHQVGLKWPPVTSRTTYRSRRTKSFILVYNLAIFWKFFTFDVKWYQIPPTLGSSDLWWPRELLCRCHWTDSFILIYNLSRFKNVWISTLNYPKYPQFRVKWPPVTSGTTFSWSLYLELHFDTGGSVYKVPIVVAYKVPMVVAYKVLNSISKKRSPRFGSRKVCL